MKAIVYNKKYTPYKLRIEEVPQPTPKENEILVKVKSVSLNAADYRSMKMGIIPKHKIFGSAVSGTVLSVGELVAHFQPGQDVIGDLTDVGFGGLAEYVTADQKSFALKPADISHEDAATLPVAATTALKALRYKGQIRKGQHVLIVGSSGGVGTAAVQLASYFGAHVTAVCSTKNIKQALSLGAEKALGYTENNFMQDGTQYDLILGINGNYSLLGYRKKLKPQGTYVMVGGALSQVFKALIFGKLLSFGGKKIKTLAAKTDANDLAHVAQLVNEGHIKAVITKRYVLEQAPEAMYELSTGHTSGKVVVNL